MAEKDSKDRNKFLQQVLEDQLRRRRRTVEIARLGNRLARASNNAQALRWEGQDPEKLYAKWLKQRDALLKQGESGKHADTGPGRKRALITREHYDRQIVYDPAARPMGPRELYQLLHGGAVSQDQASSNCIAFEGSIRPSSWSTLASKHEGNSESRGRIQVPYISDYSASFSVIGDLEDRTRWWALDDTDLWFKAAGFYYTFPAPDCDSLLTYDMHLHAWCDYDVSAEWARLDFWSFVVELPTPALPVLNLYPDDQLAVDTSGNDAALHNTSLILAALPPGEGGSFSGFEKADARIVSEFRVKAGVQPSIFVAGVVAAWAFDGYVRFDWSGFAFGTDIDWMSMNKGKLNYAYTPV